MKSKISKSKQWVQQQLDFSEQAELTQKIKVQVLEYKGQHTNAETNKYYCASFNLQRPFNRVHPKENHRYTNDDNRELSGILHF